MGLAFIFQFQLVSQGPNTPGLLVKIDVRKEYLSKQGPSVITVKSTSHKLELKKTNEFE